MPGLVYILEDEEGRYYVGSTDNIERRLKAHSAGHTQTTRNMRSPKLVLCQKFQSLAEARKIERWLKGLKRKDYISKMVSDGRIDKSPSSFNG